MNKPRDNIMNYANPEFSELEYREDLYSYISDEYKSLHGYRPRHLNFDDMETSELADLAEGIEKLIIRKIREDAEKDAKNVAAFEEEILNNLSMGAEDRDAAIRWYLDARDLLGECDSKYICYLTDLPYSMAPIFSPYTISTKG